MTIRHRCTVLIAIVLLLAPFALAEEVPAALELYVATNGNDSWTGRLSEPNADATDGPFATLRRARDEIRAARSGGELAGPVRVIVRGGTYSLGATLELAQEDSGTQQSPISYSGHSGEEVRISGGVSVPELTPVTDPAVLQRLDESARENVLQADLKALGITDFGSPKEGGIELFFNDQPMTLSRWPNDGFVRIVDLVEQDGHQIHGIKGSKTGKFVYDGDRPQRWIGENAPWLHGYWFWDWSDQRMQLKSVDAENKVIELLPPEHSYGYRKNQWYYAFNLLSEIDSPGEWYVDRDAGILYFWPPAPAETGKTVVSNIQTAFSMTDVSYVTIARMTVEAVRGSAITMKAGAHNRVVGLTLRNIGGNAITVAEGFDHGVIGCDMYAMGDGGVMLSGGDRTSLTPAGHFAENNHIHDYGRWNRMYKQAISLQGVGNRASNNLIHNAPHIAISFGGNEHVMEFNEIHSVCHESNDAGAIYTGRNWTMRGNIIRHNYLHHISGFEGKGCVGVYLDDMFSSAAIYGNIFNDVTRAAFIGGGRDCSIENNIFINCNPALHVDARALGWAHGHADEWIEEAGSRQTLQGIAYDKPPYSERYPQLVNIIDDEPKAPKGNIIARNICWGGRWDGIEDKARPYLDMHDNLVSESPEHASPEELTQTPPAFPKGFQAIPMEKIGLYEDESRASWPVQHRIRPAGKPAE